MNERHMSVGLKNACSNARAPGASRKVATSAASTTIVLIVEIVAARLPLPRGNSRGPRPADTKVPGCAHRPPAVLAGSPSSGSTGSEGWFGSMRRPRAPCYPPGSGLDDRELQVDAQVLLLQRGERAVGLQARDGLVHAGDQLA